MMKRTLYTALAAAAISTSALIAPAMFSPAAAEVDVNVMIGVPPPPPVRYEVVPAPRSGYVWAPGHWRWDGRQHVWVGGVWMPHRVGYTFVPDRWERYYDNGHERWRYQASRWDRNGDGIPDRYQARSDRDHDGVPDRYDNYPNNPYRR
jgi:hypothetical protein